MQDVQPNKSLQEVLMLHLTGQNPRLARLGERLARPYDAFAFCAGISAAR